MLKIKYVIGAFCILLVQTSFGQIKINANASTSNVNSSSAFLDASSSPLWNNASNASIAKGLTFPRADLTKLTPTMLSNPSATNNPNAFDGTLVYNTTTGKSIVGGVNVKPGFYYYSNSSATVAGGTWVSVGSGSSASVKPVIADYTVLDDDATLLCNLTNNSVTVTLPAPSTSNSGKTYVIRKIDNTANAITFSPALIYEIGTTVASLNYVKTVRVQSDGTNWNIID